MWYFAWILGLGLALAFGVLNAIWYEILEGGSEEPVPPSPYEHAARDVDRLH